MAWTEERVAKLTKLWSDGLSASQIARALGDVTRNAVIGRVHRLGLSGRTKRIRSDRPRVSRKRRKSPLPLISIPETVEEARLPDGEFVTVATLKDTMCRWPYGDPSTDQFHFCGQQVGEYGPYCTAHAQVAYQPSNRRHAPARKAAAAAEQVQKAAPAAAEADTSAPEVMPQKTAVA